jgi:hypothetical protein
MSTATTPLPSLADDDAVARLLEAERAWSAQLEVAHAEAERIVAQARSDAARMEAELDATLPTMISARRRELDGDRERAIADTIESLRQTIARYTAASDELVSSMAEQTAARAPWFGPVADDSSGV